MTKHGHKYSFGPLLHSNVPGGNFCQWKLLTGTFLKIGHAKSKVSHMTNYSQKYSFGSSTPFKMYQVGTALLDMKFFSTFLKFEIQRSKFMVTTWPNVVQNTCTVLGVITESVAHCKRGFWRPMCDTGILNQPEGRGIPSVLQHWVPPCFTYINIHFH